MDAQQEQKVVTPAIQQAGWMAAGQPQMAANLDHVLATAHPEGDPNEEDDLQAVAQKGYD